MKIYGKLGEEWLAKLPCTIENFQRLWGLSNLKPFSNLSFNIVLEGLQGTTPIILKLSPDAELIDKELKALHAFKGYGAVSVLAGCEGGLLLERAIPGKPLKNSLPKEQRVEIASKVIERLHQAPIPSKNHFPLIEEWLASIDKEWNLPIEHVMRARGLKRDLIKNGSKRKVLLHGDLHQENILSHGNGFIVIDPKGVIGDPIHEVWACVEDPAHDLKFFADYFGYTFRNVANWYYVRLILAACWQVEDCLDPHHFLSLASSVLPMIETSFIRKD